MPAMYHGATYVLHERFEPATLIETCARARDPRDLVPSQIIALLHAAALHRRELHSLEMLCSVGAPLHREHQGAN